MTSKNWLGGIRRLLSSAAAFVAMAVAATALSSAQAIEFDQEKLKRAQAIGKLTWYGSIYPETLRDRLVKEFEELTGLDVNIYVGGTGQIVSRLETERKAGSYNVDVFDGADLEVIDNALIKTGLNAPVHALQRREHRGEIQAPGRVLARHVFLDLAARIQHERL